jgi:hypothetical protein
MVGIMKRRLPLERFIEKVDKRDDGCWIWKAFAMDSGYGKFSLGGKSITSHRASWIIHRGVVQEGLCVLHYCDNPPCVNPDHLFLGTQYENIEDRNRKGRTYSPYKITHEQAVEIRRKYRKLSRTAGYRAIASEYGVSVACISRIINNSNKTMTLSR